MFFQPGKVRRTQGQLGIRFGCDEFAAGFAHQIFRDTTPAESRKLSAELRSEELQETIMKKFPTLYARVNALEQDASKNGSLRMLMFFIRGAKSEDALEVELMEKHIINWRSPQTMYAEIKALCIKLKGIGAEEEINALLKLSQSNGMVAMRCAHAALISAVRGKSDFSKQEIRQGLASAVRVLNAW